MRNLLPIALAVMGAGPAIAAPVISVSGAYDVGVSASNFAGSTNPLSITGVVPDAPTAISVGSIDAFASVSGTVLSFQHDQFGVGSGDGLTSTRIEQTFTNASPGNVRLRFDTTILAGVISLAASVRSGDDLVSISAFPVGTLDLLSDLDFEITVDGVTLYTATASLRSGGGAVVETLGGSFTSLLNLQRTEVLGSIFYSWDNTDLSFDLGVLAPGADRTVVYSLSTTTTTDSLCFWRVEGCGVAQVSFGDPRSGGGVIFLAGTGTGRFGITAGDSDIVPFDVPTPASLALFGLGAAALLLRRRRTLP